MSSLAEIVTEPTAAVVLSDALLSEGLQEFGVSTDLTAEELFGVALDSYSAGLYMAVKAGVAFLATKEALKMSDSDIPESTFKSWLKNRGLTEQRAYESIRLARGYLAIPAAQRKSYLSLGKYKAIKLASIEPEALAELAESDPEAIDAMAFLSRRDLVARINRLQTDLNTAQAQSRADEKSLAPPCLSREADQAMQAALNAEAMGAAALDLLNRQIMELGQGGDFLEERLMALHCCVSALLSRASLALVALEENADAFSLAVPPRPQMVLSESMAREYLAAHTGYIETAIELAQKQLLARSDVMGRGRGRPKGSKGGRA